MSKLETASAAEVAPDQAHQSPPLSGRDLFMHDFAMENKREEFFRKYPDWTLLERINLNHPGLLAELLRARREIEAGLQADNSVGDKNLLQGYRKKLDKFHEVFDSERTNLDKVKKVQQEAVRFNAVLKSESKSMPSMITATEVDTDKKLLRKMHREIKHYVKEMKQLTAHLYDNMTMLPHDAFTILGEINHLETNFSRLSEAIVARNENYFPKVARKPGKGKKAAAIKVKKVIEESLIVMNLIDDMRANLSGMKKNMAKYERAFKAKKAEISGKVIWRLAPKTASQDLPTNAREELMARMAINSEARKVVDDILVLQSELENIRHMTSGLMKNGNDKIFSKIIAEVDSKRDKHWAKIAGNEELSLDAKKAAEFVDAESVAEILKDEESLAARIKRGGYTTELKEIIKLLKELIAKYQKLYQHEDKIASSIRAERKLLERRLLKLTEMDEASLQHAKIKPILDEIAAKMQSLQDPTLNKAKSTNVIDEIEKLIKSLIQQKKSLEHTR